MKRFVSWICIGGVLLALAGCQNEPAPPSVDSSSEPVSSAPSVPVNVTDLVVSLESEPSSLDPAGYQSRNDGTILSHLFEGLMVLDSQGVPQPGQAESVSFDEKKKICTFILRENLVWSDGEPLKASDFVYAWQRVVSDRENESGNAELFSAIQGYEEAVKALGSAKNAATSLKKLKISAPDDRTLTVELAGDYDNFLVLCSTPPFFPVREDVVAKGEHWADRPATLVCNGPYVLTAQKAGSYVRLSRNERYRDVQSVGPRTIEFVLGGNRLSMLSAFQKGELMFADSVPYTELSQLQDSEEYVRQGNLGAAYLGFNTSRAPLDDVNLRRALTLAINRNYLCNWVSMKGDVPATALLCDGIADADEYVEFRAVGGEYLAADAYQEQMKEAEKLLEEAGYSKKKGGVKLTYLVSEDSQSVQVAEAIAAMWKEVLGIQCEVKACSAETLANRKAQGDYDVIGDSYVDTVNDPSQVLNCFISDNEQNIAKYQSEAYDQLLASASAAENVAEKYRLYHEAEDLLMEEAVVCPVYFMYNENYVLRSGVEGFYITSTGYKFFMGVHEASEESAESGVETSQPPAES